MAFNILTTTTTKTREPGETLTWHSLWQALLSL